MSSPRIPADYSAQSLTLEENEKRSLVSSLIARLRAGETLTQEFNQLGLQQMNTPDGVIWYKGARPRYVSDFFELVLALVNQRYEGEVFFIENRAQLRQFTNKMLQITESLAQGEIAAQLKKGGDATAKQELYNNFLLIKQSILEADLSGQVSAQTEKQQAAASASNMTVVDANTTQQPSPARAKLQNISAECMTLLLQTKKEFQKKKATLETVNLALVLQNYSQIINRLKNSILMYPGDSEEEVIEEFGQGLNTYSGLIKKGDSKALIAAIDQGLAEIIADSKARDESCFLELAYLCRSQVSALSDELTAERNCLTYFNAGILVEPGELILATDHAYNLRCEALRTYSKIPNDFEWREESKTSQLSDKESAVFKVETYMNRAKANKDLSNFMAAITNYCIAEWMIRSDLDLDPSCSIVTIKHKKNKVLRQLREAAAGKNSSATKTEVTKNASETKAKDESLVSPLMSERADAIARELELEELKAEKKALKKEKHKNAKKAKAAVKKEETMKLAAEAEALRKAAAEEAAKLEAEKAEANKKAAEAEAARLVAQQEELKRRAAEAEAARLVAEQEELKRKAAEAEAARLAAEQEALKRKEAELESIRSMAQGLIRKAAEEAVNLSSENTQAKMALLAQQEALKQQEKKQKESPLQDFIPDAFFPELTRETIGLLKKLSYEVERTANKVGSGARGAQLEIYGSFVLYFAMLLLSKEKTRQPQDLDLLIDMKGLIFQRGGAFIESLKSLGFTVKERNSYKAYVKLELPLPPSSGSTGRQKGEFDISLTVAFNGYKSINRLHLTRHRLCFDHRKGLVSFDDGDERQKKELYEDILQNVGKVDLWDLMRPSLDIVNFFSRVLKFYFEYNTLFKMDEASILKILRDWQWSKKYFYNRLGRNCRAFHVDPELAKDNSFLEMADLIARNYFSCKEAQALIMGFVAALVEAFYVENALKPLNEEQLAEVAHRVAVGLQQRYQGNNYQQQGKKKAEIIADFHVSLVQNLSAVLGGTIVKSANGVLSSPLLVKNFYQKLREDQLRMENERILQLQAAALSRSSLPGFQSTHQAVVTSLAVASPTPPPVLSASLRSRPSLEEQVNLTFLQLQAASARVSNWQQAQAQSFASQASKQPSYTSLELPHLWKVPANKSLSSSANSRKIIPEQGESLATETLPTKNQNL